MKIPFFISSLAVCAALSPHAFAASFEWNGAGGNMNWSTPANWTGNNAPVSASDTTVVFNSPNGVGTAPNMDIGSAFNLNRLEIIGAGINTSPLNLQGGTLNFVSNGVTGPSIFANRQSTSTLNNNMDIAAGSMLTIQLTTYHLNLNGVISGSGGIDKLATSGGINLNNSNNSFSGGLIIRGVDGNWNKVNVTASGAMGTGTVQLHGGTLGASYPDPGGLIFFNNTTHQNAIELHQHSPILAGLPAGSDLVTLNGNINLNSYTLHVRGGGTGTSNGTISGSGGVFKLDQGTWNLHGNNTYTGSTIIDNGVLSVSSIANGGVASSIGQSSNEAQNLQIRNGGTLRYTGAETSTDRKLTLSGVVRFNIATGSSLTFSSLNGSVVNDNTHFVKTGGGDLTFTSTGNVYLGQSQSINVLGGRLLGNAQYNTNMTSAVGDAIVLGDGVTMGVPAVLQTYAGDTSTQTLRYIGTTQTATLSGLLTFAGNAEKIFDVNNGAAEIDLLVTNGTEIYQSGENTRLVKRGAGTLSVTHGNHKYEGGVRVEQGAFLANNTNGSATGTGAVQVQNGGVLGGRGFIQGTTTLENGARLTPGATPQEAGTLTFNSDLIFGVSAESLFQIRGANTTITHQSQIASLTDPTDQALNDLVKVGGNVSFDGRILLELDTYAPQWGDVIDLFDFSSSSGSLPDFEIASGSLGAYSFDTSRFMDLGVLVVVPEPSKTVLGMLALASMSFIRRRSSSKRG